MMSSWIGTLVIVLFPLTSMLIADDAVPEEQAGQSPPNSSSGATKVDPAEVQRLIARLNANTFSERDEASRALAALGSAALPQLVDATEHGSAEVRERVLVLLANYEPFDEVAPHLFRMVAKSRGAAARILLEVRCLQQIDTSGELRGTESLLKFWGTSQEAYRASTVEAFKKAKTNSELARIVEPLVGLAGKAATFDGLVRRLSKFSVACDQRYATGYVVAEVLARGLRENRQDCVAFATDYVEALEALAGELRQANKSPSAIRDEITNRTGWCQGATSYLAQMLDAESPASVLVTRRLGMTTQFLREDFFRGLGSTNPETFARGVGRIHIVDLFGESLQKWPTAPGDGPVAELVDRIARCAKTGEKPKALVCIEALDACRELDSRGLDVRSGLGKKLSERYVQVALHARDHRGYQSARGVHNKVKSLLESGISLDHEAFPQDLLDKFAAATDDAALEKQQVSLERYTAILVRLTKLGCDLRQPGAVRFTRAVRNDLGTGKGAIAELDQKIDTLTRGPKVTAAERDQLLAAWADEIEKRSGK